MNLEAILDQDFLVELHLQTCLQKIDNQFDLVPPCISFPDIDLGRRIRVYKKIILLRREIFSFFKVFNSSENAWIPFKASKTSCRKT